MIVAKGLRRTRTVGVKVAVTEVLGAEVVGAEMVVVAALGGVARAVIAEAMEAGREVARGGDTENLHNLGLEHTITLAGDVRDRHCFHCRRYDRQGWKLDRST